MHVRIAFLIVKVKVKVEVKLSLDRPLGFQEFEAPRFPDNHHMKVVMLSALCTGRFTPKELVLVLLISVKG
jgi:hypothetical protein